MVTSFLTLFYIIASFQWFLWSFGWRDVETSMGVGCIFFPSAFFLFASDLFQAFSLQDTDGGSHPALGCSSISGGRWGWDLLRTLWGGYLLPAHHESTINLCRKFYTVNTSFCLLLQPRISRPSGLTIMQMFVDTQKKLPQLFNILKRWTRAAE